MERTPPKASIQSNKVCKICFEYIRTLLHQRPTCSSQAIDSTLCIRAKLAAPQLLYSADSTETNLAKIAAALNDRFGHHLTQLKQSEDTRSNIQCHTAMKKQVINKFPTMLAHTTPINYQFIPLRRLSTVGIFPRAVQSTRRTPPSIDLGPSDALPRKGANSCIIPKGIIVQSNLKYSISLLASTLLYQNQKRKAG